MSPQNELFAHIESLQARIRELEEGCQEIIRYTAIHKDNRYSSARIVFEIATKLLNQPQDRPRNDSTLVATGLNDRKAQITGIAGQTATRLD
ncbi:MAG: hypothetical protein WAZ60_23815 [Desulfosalsimonadaceae bacterium]